MKNFLFKISLLSIALLLPYTALAQESTDENQVIDFVGFFMQLVDGVQNKNWLLVTCLVLMTLIWVWNLFIMPKLVSGKKHPKWKAASPWISIGVAVVMQFSAAIIDGNSLADALNTAITMGLTASGMWSGGGKYVGNYVERKFNGTSKKSLDSEPSAEPSDSNSPAPLDR
jgi:hypothetical protein